jgi:hypothetical protein
MMHEQVIRLDHSNIVHQLFMIHINLNQLNSEIFVSQEISVVEHFQLKKMVIK